MTAVLEDHGLQIAPDGCSKLRAWADEKIREDSSARGQGDLHDLPINRLVLGARLGSAATEALLGHPNSFHNEMYRKVRGECLAGLLHLRHLPKESHAPHARMSFCWQLSQGLSWACRA